MPSGSRDYRRTTNSPGGRTAPVEIMEVKRFRLFGIDHLT